MRHPSQRSKRWILIQSWRGLPRLALSRFWKAAERVFERDLAGAALGRLGLIRVWLPADLRGR
jgi:hypothetical protein